MEQENKIVFRNALNGYHKTDVNEYITELAKEFARRKEDFESESARLHDALKAESAEKDALAEKYKKLTAEHDVVSVSKKKTETELAKATESLKINERANSELKAEVAKLKEELEAATAALAAQRDSAAKQKKNADALASELTTLKNKFSDKNAELDALKKSLSDAEQVNVERYAALIKQNALVEKYEAEIQGLKADLGNKEDALSAARNELLKATEKTAEDNGTETIVAEIRTSVDQMIATLDGKLSTLDEKLTNLSIQPTKESKKEEAPAKEKVSSDLDKKIDAFFSDAE